MWPWPQVVNTTQAGMHVLMHSCIITILHIPLLGVYLLQRMTLTIIIMTNNSLLALWGMRQRFVHMYTVYKFRPREFTYKTTKIPS